MAKQKQISRLAGFRIEIEADVTKPEIWRQFCARNNLDIRKVESMQLDEIAKLTSALGRRREELIGIRKVLNEI